jgi:hypothetical protein
MASFLRLPLALFLLLATLMLLGGMGTRWAAGLGLEGLDLGALRVILNAQLRETEILNNEEIVRRRLRAKHEITCELLEGRLSLFEAAARFGKLEEQTSEYIGYSRDPHPGETVEERLCRQVIMWANQEAAVRPYGEPQLRVGRLQEELQEHIRQHSAVRLPEE